MTGLVSDTVSDDIGPVMRRVLRRPFGGALKYDPILTGLSSRLGQSEERICLYFPIRLLTTQKLTHERIRRGVQ